MYETQAEIDELQRLLDASFARASTHLTSIMTRERRMTAQRVVELLTGIAVLNVATVTARGEPRISALDGHFLHGRWYFTTGGNSPKARQLRARPAVSAAYTPADGVGVFCHGTARELDRGTPEFDELHEHLVRTYGQSPDEMGPNIAYVAIDPGWLVGFEFTPAA